MMQRDIHLKPRDLLNSFQFRDGDFGEIGIVSGQPQRVKLCLERLNKPVKNFSFLGYTFWTGEYKGKKITVGNGGMYSPDAGFITELLCEGKIEYLIRIGSCGSLREDIDIGSLIIPQFALRGEGTTSYYVDKDFIPRATSSLVEKLFSISKEYLPTFTGGVWTTDALLRETKEIVNSYIEKGAIAVDMVTSAFFTIANIYKKNVCAILAVSDNLITGRLGFNDFKFFEAQQKMTNIVFKLIENI